MNSCRKALDCLCNDDGASNASLVMERFLAEIKEDVSKDARGGDSAIMVRTRLYEQMKKALKGAKSVYETAYRRRESAFKTAGAMLLEFRTTAPLAVGLGGKNVLENGLSLEHTYGVPIIPASSLKGVLVAYCAEALKNTASGEEAAAWLENRKVIFGSVAAGGASAKGYVRFHDAWITPESLENCLHDDVVTCHHSGYYSQQDPAVPSDFDDPVPVSFVSVRGTFLVVCDCEEPDAGRKKALLAEIGKLFEHVLGERGVGAKRSSGYGRLNRQPSTQEKQEAHRGAQREIARKDGMKYIEGDIVEAMCCGFRKVKGKAKPRYKLVDEDSAQNVSFSPGIPHAREGETFRAEVIACDLEKKIYTLKLIEEP